MLTTIRQALHLIGRDQRNRWLLLLLLALGTSLLEVIAAGLVYILLGLVANPSGTVDLPVLGDVRRFAGDLQERTFLLILVAVMAAFFLIKGAIVVASEYIISRVINNAAGRLSVKLISGYLRLPYAFHLQHHSSELIRNGYQAIFDVGSSVFGPVIRVLAEVVLTLGILSLLLVVSPVGTGLAVLVVGGSSALLLLVIQPRLKRIGAMAHAAHRDNLAILQHSLHGVRDIKILGRETYFSDTFSRMRMRLSHAFYVRSAMSQLPRTVIETSLILFILLFFAISLIFSSASRGSMLSVLGLFGYAGLRLQPSLQRIIGGMNDLRYSTAPMADIYRDLLLIESSSVDHETHSRLPFENELRVENVSFCYEGGDGEALREVNLCIRRGEQVGICGPTGGGKTTLIDIVTGLLSPTQGRVTVDGQDISTNISGWQCQLGVVPQMVFLIDDTLRRNIALGIPDSEIDDTAVEEAIKLAQLQEFVESLPGGLNTKLGERGVKVSGGERQRIAIARALYIRPEVLVFDEGTSALDNATEREFMDALTELRGTRTILLVAHRLSTVKSANRIVFIRDGRIDGIDTYEGLRATNALFREMSSA